MSDLQVIVKAKEMSFFIMKTTSNCNRFPKKYRFSLVDKMQKCSMEIYQYLLEANRTNVNTEKAERRLLQTKAITGCDLLLYYIELSVHLDILSNGKVEYWTKIVTDVKYMTLAWRSKTK